MTGNKRTLWLLGKIGFWILVIFIFFYMLFPFYWAVNSSLKSEAQLQMTPATFLPVDSQGRFSPTLQNYVAIFKDGTFVRALWNSTIVAGLTTILALCVGSFAAYAMGKLRFKGKKATLYLILSLTMFPQITVLSGLYAVITT
ncbi:MAG TPA: carbohydrate ABC transporter permease, partial [Mesotoga sp.]|nr:carbohydrate ABC transporter permease [Mesotoga sp.]